jgi:putative DNA primase/helicase
MTAAEALTEALGGHWRGSYGEALCPAHQDRRPSLSIRDGETEVILKCHKGCTSGAVVDALRRRGRWPVQSIEKSSPRRRRPSPGDLHRSALAIWRAAQPIEGSPGETYLRQRCIAVTLPPSLRYHSALRHSATGLVLPAVVAAITGNDHRVVAIQRTFIRGDGRGKAPVSNPKMTLAPMGAGAVRLAAAGDVLGVAEGVETGLSATQLFGISTWASLGAERLGRLELPPEVRRIVIFGDNGSEAAAYRARDAFRGRGLDAECRFPDPRFKDFNDALAGNARAA